MVSEPNKVMRLTLCFNGWRGIIVDRKNEGWELREEDKDARIEELENAVRINYEFILRVSELEDRGIGECGKNGNQGDITYQLLGMSLFELRNWRMR
jgi:hypothetical protein